jgi:hypothetical protein
MITFHPGYGACPVHPTRRAVPSARFFRMVPAVR